MGSEFVEFPPVIHFHLRRFTYDAQVGRADKITDRLEFPLRIDLTEFLPVGSPARSRSNVYDLYGVLVHAGGVMNGHYYAYLRTSTSTEWYRFNDASVTRVSQETAVSDNFGAEQSPPRRTPTLPEIEAYRASPEYQIEHSHRTFTTDKPVGSAGFSAYMLIYIRREDAGLLMEPVPEESVPRHLRDFVAAKRSPIHAQLHRSVSETVHVSYIHESALRGLTAAAPGSRFWTAAADPWRELSSSATTAELYQLMSEECGNGRIRIWYCDVASHKPTMLILNNPAKPIKSFALATDSLSLFVQPLTADEPLEVSADRRMAYIKFFFPEASAPLQFLMSVTVPIAEPITSVYEKVNEFLGFPSGTPLSAFGEDYGALRPMSEDTPLSKLYVPHGLVVILQVTPPNAMPPIPTEFRPVESDAPAAEVAEEESPLPRVRLGISDSNTVEAYMANLTRFQIEVYDQENPDSPLFLLETPQKTLFVDIKVAIGEFLQRPYDPAKDAILLATAAPTGNGLHFTPADIKVWPSLQYRLTSSVPAGWVHHRLYFRWLQGIPEAMAGSFTTALVTFSEDTRTVLFGQQLTVAKTGKCADLVRALGGTRDIGDGPFRVLLIADHQITAIMSEKDDYAISWAVPTIRVERVPEDQRAHDGAFVAVTFCIVNAANRFGFLKATGDPMVAPVVKEEVWANTKVRLAEQLSFQPGDDAWKIGTLYSYHQLKDTDVIHAGAWKGSNQALLVIMGATQGKPVRRGETSVRIYN
jgi:ubiquitin carboxyl-terminal hydrolase 7